MIPTWRCKCENKRNSNGLRRCRKCGAIKPEYTTDGSHIVRVPQKPSTPAKRLERAKKDDSASTDTGRRESFIESTLKFIDEKDS